MAHTHVALVIDASTSMQGIKTPALDAFNGMIRGVVQGAAQYLTPTTISLYTFADYVAPVFRDQPSAQVPEFLDGNYRPNGNTALFDAIGRAVEDLEVRPDQSDTAYLVKVVTDGEENQSHRHSATSIRKLIADKQATGQWTFVFLLPPGKKARFCRDFYIPEDNVREWDQTAKGVEEAGKATAQGTLDYFGARSVGQTAVKKFFVKTNLSKLTKADIQAKLTDVTQRFKGYQIDQEGRTDIIGTAKTGKPYVVGSVFYLLMKAEKVQANKEVVLVEKGKRRVWGGPAARELLGLPVGAEARVTPGNHADYDIYIQSNAYNRLIPRGTKVLIDVELKASKPATWQPVPQAGAAV